jgi:hypothetical protein
MVLPEWHSVCVPDSLQVLAKRKKTLVSYGNRTTIPRPAACNITKINILTDILALLVTSYRISTVVTVKAGVHKTTPEM